MKPKIAIIGCGFAGFGVFYNSFVKKKSIIVLTTNGGV